MTTQVLQSIAFDIGVIVLSVVASFILPGIAGVILSGVIQFFGDLGIQIKDEADISLEWLLTEFFSIVDPLAGEFGKYVKKESRLLLAVETKLGSFEKKLDKASDWIFESIEALKNKAELKISSSTGLSPALEQEIKQVETQEAVREKMGKDVEITKKIVSFQPNTKKPTSPMAGIGFKETARFGPRDIRGELYFIYYFNNHKRIGYVQRPLGPLTLGRTSDANKDKYRKKFIAKDKSVVKTVKVVFPNARYYGDYLASLRAKSWFGNYMRKWMRGLPGRKPAVNNLLLFGSVFRVYTKLKALGADQRDLIFNSKDYAKSKGLELFGRTRVGSVYSKTQSTFSQGQAIKNTPYQEASNKFKSLGESYRDKQRERGGK